MIVFQFIKTSSVDKTDTWRQVADLPVTEPTCESFDGRLLAIGGMTDMSSVEYSRAMYQYNSTTNTWGIISHMISGRHKCFSAVLPDNQLVIVGGTTNSGTTGTVEIASICN